MQSVMRLLCAAAACCGAQVGVGAGAAAPSSGPMSPRHLEVPPPDAIYRQASQPVAVRARDLLSRMTLKEKTAQLLQPWETKSPAEVFAQFNDSGLGAWYLTMTTLPPNRQQHWKKPTTPEERPVMPAPPPPPPPTSSGAATVKARNEMQRLFVEKTRLGIPVTFIMETLHSGGPDATIFPMPVNFASSWNASSMEAAARVIAAEARAVGTDRGFSPVINLFPDARYGRVQEGYSEDPWLTKVFGAAHLRGLQGDAMGGPDTYLHNFTHALIATVKHYAACEHDQYAPPANELGVGGAR
jgi:beta-glucosidase-like glycosyl hydrolase